MRTALNTHVSWWRRRRHEVALGDHDTAMPAEQGTVASGGLVAVVTARDSLAGVHVDTPLDAIARNGRARRRWHRLTGATAAMAVTGAALAVTALAPAGPSSSPSGRVASHPPAARLAARTVDRQANGDIKVTVRQLSDPSGPQRTLRAGGVPASVTVPGHPAPSCRPYPMSRTAFMSVYPYGKAAASGDTVLIIDPYALPRGAGVQIGAAVAAHNSALRPALVYASPRCTGS